MAQKNGSSRNDGKGKIWKLGAGNVTGRSRAMAMKPQGSQARQGRKAEERSEGNEWSSN